jgi:NAD-dependent deacetylase
MAGAGEQIPAAQIVRAFCYRSRTQPARRRTGIIEVVPTDELRARRLLAAAGRITVLTGAGVSTDSGIPDFRGPNGVWTRDPGARRLSTLEAYRGDPGLRRESWRRRLEHPAWTAEPNAGHRALVALEGTGRLLALITQNIDGLHQIAGSDPRLVIELHGTLAHTECLSCGARGEMADALRRVRAGAADPDCERCGGILKSATVSFGQRLDPHVLARARAAAEAADVLLVVGSSLTVQPAAGLVGSAAAAGAHVMIINADPTPYDGLAAIVLRGRIGELLPAAIPG